MWFWIGVISSILSLSTLMIMLSHIYIRVQFKRIGQDDRIDIDVKALYGMVRHRFEIPFMDFKGPIDGTTVHSEHINQKKHKVTSEKDKQVDPKTIMDKIEHGKKLIRHFFGFTQWLKQTLSYVTCTKFEWNTRIGWGDASITGMSVGGVWAVKSSLVGFMTHMMSFQSKPNIEVEPVFNKDFFATEGLCIVKIRAGKAMIAGVRFLVRIIKIKGGFKAWKNTLLRTS